MDTATGAFIQAQALFNSFQRNWNYPDLEKSLFILDDIISESGPDSKKANNLKNTIKTYIQKQIRKIAEKYNFEEFDNDLLTLLVSADDKDTRVFFALCRYLDYLNT